MKNAEIWEGEKSYESEDSGWLAIEEDAENWGILREKLRCEKSEIRIVVGEGLGWWVL